MPVTPNIIHTAKQMVNAHVVANKTEKLRGVDVFAPGPVVESTMTALYPQVDRQIIVAGYAAI
jgi:hypothetical protein